MIHDEDYHDDDDDDDDNEDGDDEDDVDNQDGDAHKQGAAEDDHDVQIAFKMTGGCSRRLD